ncbi:MAG: helix-turn-helix domain-containing protein [Planctomycetota bacterium]|nr:helix-turn-helix domain-containing protein [Planctomycetota bacterium]
MDRSVSSAANPERGTPDTALLSVDEVSTYLTCSTRHVRRLADAGAMPRPVKLGTLVRWRRVDIERWVADGCPRCDRRSK